MEIILDTAPVVEPVSVLEVKKHLNIESEYFNDDEYIDSLIPIVRENAEQVTRRRLITQTWLAYFDGWPSSDYLELPFGTLQSVTSVKYYETDDTENTMAAADYGVDTDSMVGRIVLDYGESWPTETLRPRSPIKIEFVCGYGTAGSDVPGPIIQAIKIGIADLFWARSSEQPANVVTGRVGNIFNNLLRNYRIGTYESWL